jgi:hypothetical protein
MKDLLDTPLLAAVLTTRHAMDDSQAALVDARAHLWRAAREAGLEPVPHRIGQHELLPEALLQALHDRTDAPAEAFRVAYQDLAAAETHATESAKVAGRALRDFRASLPPAYRGADLVERLLGRSGRQYHRVFVLESAGAADVQGATALCGRKRSLLWRIPSHKLLESELCRACQRARIAAPEDVDEVPGDSIPARTRRLRLPSREELRRAFPAISIFGALALAAGLAGTDWIMDSPVVRGVLSAIGPASGIR